ncbi:MAG: hypothetical protein K1X63_15005 [Chitinophagales bacterium]|nr:hypothetical protein [Chitinophagales bacterium]
MILFWILWGIDAVVAAIAVYFFFIGLVDGSVSSFNIKLWIVLLIVLAALLTGTLFLRHHSYLSLSKILLAVVAVPALLYAIFIFVAVITGARWN